MSDELQSLASKILRGHERYQSLQTESIMQQHVSEVLKIRHEHIEKMAAAYLKATDIPPEEVMLYEQTQPNGVMTWWFQKRPASNDVPEPYASFSNLDLLRAVAHEADLAKRLLRLAGFGVTGTGLLETVKEALAALAEVRADPPIRPSRFITIEEKVMNDAEKRVFAQMDAALSCPPDVLISKENNNGQ